MCAVRLGVSAACDENFYADAFGLAACKKCLDGHYGGHYDSRAQAFDSDIPRIACKGSVCDPSQVSLHNSVLASNLCPADGLLGTGN